MPLSPTLFDIQALDYYEAGFVYFLFFVIGLCLGSFTSVIIYRVPRGESWIFHHKSSSGSDTPPKYGHSACPDCGHHLKIRDLIPLLSWILQRGRCRYCNSKIPSIYPLLELICGVLCVGIVWKLGLSSTGLYLLFTVPFMVALTFIDLKYFKLPNHLILIVAIIGACHIVFPYLVADDWYITDLASLLALAERFFSAFIYALLAYLLGGITSLAMGRSSLGFGDVKLFGACGLWLDFSLLPFFMIFAGLFGILFGVVWQKLSGQKLFPFGPAIIMSFYACILCV